MLIDSFNDLANTPNCQVILTTHSPGLAADLPTDSIRFIFSNGYPRIPQISSGVSVFDQVAQTLGLIPDSRVRVLICVEGPTDVIMLKHLSEILHKNDATIPNLAADDRCAFITLGGSSLKHWVSSNYLRGLRCPEIHIYDGDVVKYGESVAEVNARNDGLNSWACQTKKHELECYLHPDAVFEEYGFTIHIVDTPDHVNSAVPETFGKAYAAHFGFANPLNDKNSKSKLTRAFSKMNCDRIKARDPEGEVESWFRKISTYL